MAVNLTMNVGEELQGFPVRKLHCWLDSSVALHWIRGATMVKPKSINIKQFVLQPDAKDKAHNKIKSIHVSSKFNPADLRSHR
jgi:hypothetical protein